MRPRHVHQASTSQQAKSREYWEAKQRLYPHQVEVEQWSAQDIDPRTFARDVSRDFLRVPFDGIAHWGFRYPQTLEKFKHIVGLA